MILKSNLLFIFFLFLFTLLNNAIILANEIPKFDIAIKNEWVISCHDHLIKNKDKNNKFFSKQAFAKTLKNKNKKNKTIFQKINWENYLFDKPVKELVKK